MKFFVQLWENFRKFKRNFPETKKIFSKEGEYFRKMWEEFLKNITEFYQIMKSPMNFKITLWFFSASLCGRFRRRSRLHWNNWSCVYVLHCDSYSAHLCREWTTCPCKIAVTCVNVGSRIATIRYSCVHVAYRGTEFNLKKWILISIIFPSPSNNQQRRAEKIAACTRCKKKKRRLLWTRPQKVM